MRCIREAPQQRRHEQYHVHDAIDIADAPIHAVGVEPDGSMEIPDDVSRIGWYEYGPAPGDATGSAVLTAHIDSRTQGRGVFYDLDAVTPAIPSRSA